MSGALKYLMNGIEAFASSLVTTAVVMFQFLLQHFCAEGFAETASSFSYSPRIDSILIFVKTLSVFFNRIQLDQLLPLKDYIVSFISSSLQYVLKDSPFELLINFLYPLCELLYFYHPSFVLLLKAGFRGCLVDFVSFCGNRHLGIGLLHLPV